MVELADALEQLVRELERRHAEAAPRPALHPPVAAAHGQGVARDAEQPGDGGLPTRAEAMRARECGGERLGGEIGGDLGVSGSCKEVAQHAVLVTAVEGPERGGLPARKRQQPLVRRIPPGRFHTHTLHCLPVL